MWSRSRKIFINDRNPAFPNIKEERKCEERENVIEAEECMRLTLRCTLLIPLGKLG